MQTTPTTFKIYKKSLEEVVHPNLLNNIYRSMIVCKLCSFIAVDPICCLYCGLGFCNNCISCVKKYVEGGQCVSCKFKPFIENPLLSIQLRYLVSQISFSCFVCGERMIYSSFYEHLCTVHNKSGINTIRFRARIIMMLQILFNFIKIRIIHTIHTLILH